MQSRAARCNQQKRGFGMFFWGGGGGMIFLCTAGSNRRPRVGYINLSNFFFIQCFCHYHLIYCHAYKDSTCMYDSILKGNHSTIIFTSTFTV